MYWGLWYPPPDSAQWAADFHPFSREFVVLSLSNLTARSLEALLFLVQRPRSDWISCGCAILENASWKDPFCDSGFPASFGSDLVVGSLRQTCSANAQISRIHGAFWRSYFAGVRSGSFGWRCCLSCWISLWFETELLGGFRGGVACPRLSLPSFSAFRSRSCYVSRQEAFSAYRAFVLIRRFTHLRPGSFHGFGRTWGRGFRSWPYQLSRWKEAFTLFLHLCTLA